MRDLAEETGPGDVQFSREAKEHTIETADPAVLENFQFEVAQFVERFLVDGRTEDARFMPGPHPCRHRGKGKHLLDAEFAREVDQLAAGLETAGDIFAL